MTPDRSRNDIDSHDAEPRGTATTATALGAAAGAELLAVHAWADEKNPAAEVADRTSSLRITKLTATPVGPKVYVKLETNHGVTGWGEIDQLEPTVAAMLARSLFELLDGENPTRIEHLWQKLYRSHRDIRGGPFMVHTISGIDMALWDITGKLWGVPVYRLLGGPCRDKIRMYPTAKAQKLGSGPRPHSSDRRDIEQLADYVRRSRENVGPDGTLMFDAHCAMPPATLIQFAASIAAYDVLFIEEVAVPGNIEVFKRLKQQIKIPLATGERDRTIWEFIPYLQERCIDVLQPDLGHTGGISQVKKIATLGEAFQTPIAPHNVMSDLGTSASLHAAASVPLLLIHEYYHNVMPEGLIRKQWKIGLDGYASLPEGDGLGCEVDEKLMAQLAANPERRWQWPTHGRLPDGSISDY